MNHAEPPPVNPRGLLTVAVGVLLFGVVALWAAVVTGPWTDCGERAYQVYKASAERYPYDRDRAAAQSSDYVVTQCR